MTTPTEVSARMAQRYDTASNWTTYLPVLLAGEIGIESDTGKYKIGNGVTSWGALPYASLPGGGGEVTGNVTIEGNLTVNGTETIINVDILQVEDKSIEIGKVAPHTDVTADG